MARCTSTKRTNISHISIARTAKGMTWNFSSAAVLSLFLQLNMNGALMRFYPEATDDRERRELVGTLVLFTLAWSLIIVLGLNLVGGRLLDNVYKGVRFQPYLRMATWIAFINSLTILPLCLVQMQQRPMMHRVLSLVGFLLN